MDYCKHINKTYKIKKTSIKHTHWLTQRSYTYFHAGNKALHQSISTTNHFKLHDTERVCENLKFIVFVSKLSGGYKAVFVRILFVEDVLHHVLMQGVVGRVAVALKLFPQIHAHLLHGEPPVIVDVHLLEGLVRPRSIFDVKQLDDKGQRAFRRDLTFPFLPVGQGRRDDQFPLLSRAHVLQAFIPAFKHFHDAQSKPHGVPVTISSTGVQHGPILEVQLMMHQQHVSVLSFPVTEEGSVQDIYLHLGFRELPPADGEQHGGA